VLGIEGCDGSRLTQNMPPLLTGGRHAPVQQVEPEKPEVKPPSTSLLLDTPVRSGQSIVFPDGDVTVVGSVASGAEIVAGGSIHVYGTLRGRAMAGVNGNSSARIYCHKLEAELLAIDGYYQTAEEIPDALRDRPVQALLDGYVMRITPLS
jgi:septum site-determining protein MinC